MADIQQIIESKSLGRTLGQPQIETFIRGVTDLSVTDAQLGAFTMAVCFNGMSQEEQTAMTVAMRDSGRVLEWQGIDGPVLDKHSTGGVGDWVSLALAPLVASCGGYVPMVSGRGLGHTGGTLDKLESIPGFNVRLNLHEFRGLVAANGLAMIGQGPELAPADGRMYAIRDVTGTVESIPLIVASILSKKLAEGLDGLVLDVKTGNGAFMTELDQSRLLALNLCHAAQQSGVACHALITDMSQPLGWCAGNSVEVREAIDFLTGNARNPEIEVIILGLASEMLFMGQLAQSRPDAENRLKRALDDGSAAEKFSLMVRAQGGPSDLVDHPERHLEPAPVIRPVLAAEGGWLTAVDTRDIGMTVLRLGGGRVSVEDNIDPRVGVTALPEIGDRIEKGDPLCIVHADSEDDWKMGSERVRQAMLLEDEQPAAPPVIYEVIS